MMPIMKSARPRYAIIRLAVPVGGLLLWELLYRIGVMRASLLSSPSLIASEMWRLLRSGELLDNAAHSMSLILASFVLACLVGFPIGIAMGSKKSLENLFDPLIEFVRPIPPLALLPLAIVC